MIAQLGDKVRVAVKFTDISRTAADPDAVRLRSRDPDGVETALLYGTDSSVVRDAVGEYHSDVAVPTPGEWWFRWEGQGTLDAATESPLQVADSEFDTANTGGVGPHIVQAAGSISPSVNVAATGTTGSANTNSPADGASAPDISATATAITAFAGVASAAPTADVTAGGASIASAAGAAGPTLASGATGVSAFAGTGSASPTIGATATGTFIVFITEEDGSAMTEEDGTTVITDE